MNMKDKRIFKKTAANPQSVVDFACSCASSCRGTCSCVANCTCECSGTSANFESSKVAPHDSEVRRVRDSVFTSNTNLVDSSASSNIIWG